MVSVEEALAVLEEHAGTARSRAALSALKSDLETPGGRGRVVDPASRRKPPRFPTKDNLDEILAERKAKSAEGSHSREAEGEATARKGT